MSVQGTLPAWEQYSVLVHWEGREPVSLNLLYGLLVFEHWWQFTQLTCGNVLGCRCGHQLQNDLGIPITEHRFITRSAPPPSPPPPPPSQSANSADCKYLFAMPMSRDHTKLRHVRSEEGSCCDSLWKHKKAVFAPKMAL